jgi:acetyl-CoA carboxylase biotin carboxyl carrier protein
MNIKELEQIISILKNTDVSEFELDRDGTHIRIARGPRQVVTSHVAAPQGYSEHHVALAAAPAPSQTAHAHAPAAAPAHNPNLVKVESPIVGTFYRKPSPDAPVFAQEGDRVKKGDTLCIIEAMKLMNEIEAPVDGKLEKVLLTDGKVVEFGEVLFLINPAA